MQTNHFGGVVRLRAKELDAIITELGAAGNAETLAAVLPDHPKVALLFLRGMTVLVAAKLVQQLFAQVPTAEEEGWVALVNFCRVACTVADGA